MSPSDIPTRGLMTGAGAAVAGLRGFHDEVVRAPRLRARNHTGHRDIHFHTALRVPNVVRDNACGMPYLTPLRETSGCVPPKGP